MISNRDEYWLMKARQIAATSNEIKRHGAIVVKSGKAVGRGINKTRNNNRIVSEEHIKTDCSYHAEELALRMAGGKSRNGTIYIARVNNQDEPRYSEPCPRCQLAIEAAGIKRIVYTTTGEYQC